MGLKLLDLIVLVFAAKISLLKIKYQATKDNRWAKGKVDLKLLNTIALQETSLYTKVTSLI